MQTVNDVCIAANTGIEDLPHEILWLILHDSIVRMAHEEISDYSLDHAVSPRLRMRPVVSHCEPSIVCE